MNKLTAKLSLIKIYISYSKSVWGFAIDSTCAK